MLHRFCSDCTVGNKSKSGVAVMCYDFFCDKKVAKKRSRGDEQGRDGVVVVVVVGRSGARIL